MNLKKKVEAWASALFRGVGCVLGVRSQLYHLSAGSREAVQDKHAHVEVEQLQCPFRGRFVVGSRQGNHSERQQRKGSRCGTRQAECFIREHESKDLRITLIRPNGKVVYDNMRNDFDHFSNHINRKEIQEALRTGLGSSVERQSKTLKHDYFYVATYFPADSIIIRSALPYNNDLSKSLKADQHYIWFAIFAIILLTIVLYRFMHRLGKNVAKLRIFAYKADHNESLEIEDLATFPNDELGEIAERIIKMYKRIQTTRKEQDILKRQLTQNIAHELKTPVASIQGYLETIIDNPRISEEMKQQFLQRCYAQSERLTSLLRDISTLNRLDDGSDMIDFEAVDITQLASDIMRETALEREERKMSFHNLLPERIVVKGNRSLLYSIFRNLTDNAIAYAGEETTITLEGKEVGNKWHFIFRDNGQGVPQEHLARIFERFYRVDKGRSRKMGGTGLGLAIVKTRYCCMEEPFGQPICPKED